MHYPGGKEQLSPVLIPELLKHRLVEHTTYIEPFVGGASVFTRMAPLFPKAIAADTVLDLVLMYQELLKGWQPPDQVSFKEFECLRSAEPSALRAFVGFGCAFSGVWFQAYADHSRPVGSNAALIAKKSLATKLARIQDHPDLKFVHADYRSLNQVSRRCFMYCDPPYLHASKGMYASSRHFDSAEFWDKAYGWAAQGATILVSEYVAPKGVPCVWELTVESHIRADQRKHGAERVERLFKLDPAIVRAEDPALALRVPA